MISLFIDTCTDTLNLALIKDDFIVEELSILSKEHSVNALLNIEYLLKNNNINPKDVNKIFVTNGPGSFTGIRIGVTIAKTYAWACNINIVEISTLKAIALSYTNYKHYVPLIDARKGFVYGALYDENYNEIINDCYIELDKLLEKVSNLDNILFISDKKIDNVSTVPIKLNIQNIYDYYKSNKGINAHAVMPCYLKKTEAEEKFNA